MVAKSIGVGEFSRIRLTSFLVCLVCLREIQSAPALQRRAQTLGSLRGAALLDSPVASGGRSVFMADDTAHMFRVLALVNRW